MRHERDEQKAKGAGGKASPRGRLTSTGGGDSFSRKGHHLLGVAVVVSLSGSEHQLVGVGGAPVTFVPLK